ncbi:MAG TPA: family 10 glycosylhydrolase, partial [Chitinophagaceae bacterium]|nr:family 10 glycosylhydrolase [Chitinophagaceae bacterium]
NKEVQQFVTNVVRDVVSRYDIDAVHLDDYFYPYRIAGKEFPDSASFTKYGNGLNKDDWRRSNVDSIIVKLSTAIKEENRFCKFGVSPFGVWRNIDKDPEGSNTRAGQTNYDDLYADILLWLKNKWIDYVAPQLYWEFSFRNAPFGTLTEWWASHSYGRHLYIGHGIYRALEGQSVAWRNPNELPNQIKKIREYPEINGSIYYSSKWFVRNPNGWNDTLQNNYYRYPAIVPPMPWIDSVKAPAPKYFSIVGGTVVQQGIEMDIAFDSVNYKYTKLYAIYISPSTEGKFQLVALVPSAKILQFLIPKRLIPFYNLLRSDPNLENPWGFYMGVTAISRTNNESEMLIKHVTGPVQ